MHYLTDKYAKIISHKGFDICTLKVAIPAEGDELGYVIDDAMFQGKVFDHPDSAIEAINQMYETAGM